jgi:glycerol-3-phosphate O-acyltransferase
MKFQLAVLSVFCAAVSVNAFAPQLPQARHLCSALSSAPAPAEADASTDEAASNTIRPEYQAAIEKAIQTCGGVLQDSQPELLQMVSHFCQEYITATQLSHDKYPIPETEANAALERILTGVKLAFTYGMGENKFEFGVTHEAFRGDDDMSEKIDSKLDFYKWGCEFFRHFMDAEESLVLGKDNLKQAFEQANKGENVVFYANHQSEADPQVMSVLLESAGFAEEASRLTYVAGHKVTTDALAIPFSMGRNLICIHSKKHIDADPETKPNKTRENMKAMSGMLGKLKAGGAMIWVAPSGGRDRRDTATGKTPTAPFDSKTIDMFRLMGRKSKVTTHYYPLSMVSYELCPPPDFVEAGTGEQRNFRFTPVGINVGPEVDGDVDGAFNPGVYEETKKGYHELRERIFPGTAPDLE